MGLVKRAATPMVPNFDLWSKLEFISEPREYRHIVGSLQYATLTRSDIQLAMNRLSQFMAAPTQVHWIALKCVLHFISGTLRHKILLRQMVGRSIMVYYDADGEDTSWTEGAEPGISST